MENNELNIPTLEGWKVSLTAVGYECANAGNKLISKVSGLVGNKNQSVELTIEETEPGTFTASLKGLGEYLFGLGPTLAIEKFNATARKYLQQN